MAKKKSKKKGNSVSVNFEGVKAFKAVPEGSYVLKITGAEKGESSNDNETINWDFEVAKGEHKGAKLWYTTVLTEKSLWKLRELLEAAGQEVPDDEMDIDLDDLIGCELGAIVFHEEYEGKNRAKIGDFIAADEVDAEDEDEDDDKKSKKKGKKSKKKDEDDEEEESDEEVPDVDSMDEDELTEFVSESGLDVDLDDYKNIKKKRAAVKEALESQEDEGEEEEQEKYSEEDVMDMDTEELSKINDDHELGVEDLEDMKPKAARKAMIKALKKAKLLED